MNLISTIAMAMGSSWVSGIRLYAAVATLGLLGRFAHLNLPGELSILTNWWIIGIASGLFLIEFFADKIPYLDTAWDLVHTAIRPLGGAFVAVASVGDASPAAQGLAALLGGTLAAGSHLTKAGTRAAANTSPEPLSNWLLSLGEDGLVVGLGVLALTHPVAALMVTAVLVGLMVLFAAAIVRAVRSRFRTRPALSAR